MAELEILRTEVGPLEPVTPEAKAFIRRKQRIPDAFITAANGSLALSPDLQAVGQFSTEAVNDDTQYIDGLTPLLMNMLLAAQQLHQAIKKRKARLGTRAQKIYAVSRALALDGDAPEILSHVENMKRARKTINRPKAKGAEKPPSPPATIGVRGEGGAAA
jgi:hypothetical protein